MEGAEHHQPTDQPVDSAAYGESTRRAIDVMTAWSEQGEGKRFAADRVKAYVDAEADGAMTLTVGFINSAILSLQLQAATGCDARAILQDVARVPI
ncbi:MAG: hypothetical protein ACXWD8_01615 [Mycobacterium sp.]